MTKIKKTKDKKLPFYLKPLEKIITTTTNQLLTYFYNYAYDIYNESRSYEDWLTCFHAYMANPLEKESED